MIYDVFGPFEIPRKASGLIDMSREPKKAFWEDVDENGEGLSAAVGCYVFALRAGRGITPHYVGRTNSLSFYGECFQPQKINHYNNSIAEVAKGTPLLFLIAKRTRGGKFARPSSNGHADIDFLEAHMIGLALEKNRNLLNKRDTRFLRELEVRGLLNSNMGRSPRPAQLLGITLGL